MLKLYLRVHSNQALNKCLCQCLLSNTLLTLNTFINAHCVKKSWVLIKCCPKDVHKVGFFSEIYIKNPVLFTLYASVKALRVNKVSLKSTNEGSANNSLLKSANEGIRGRILCMRTANQRWCYSVTPSLIGWAHTQNDPWVHLTLSFVCAVILQKLTSLANTLKVANKFGRNFYKMYLYLTMKSRNLLLYKWTTGIYQNDYN